MKTLTTLAALVLLLIALPAPANAAETVHPEIEVVLEEFPTGSSSTTTRRIGPASTCP